jgi:hypothetical protein
LEEKMYKFKMALLLTISLMLMTTSYALAATYHVDTNNANASDSSAGTAAAPWKTIQKAVQTAQAGDTVYIKGGEYAVTGTGVRHKPALNPVNSGKAGSPITFEGVTGEKVNITMTSSSGPLIGASGSDYITWRNMTVTESSTFLTDSGTATLWGVDNCILDGIEIIGRDRSQMDNHDGIRAEVVTNSTIRNCIIHGYQNTADVLTANNCGIKMYKVHDTIIENNEFYNNNTCVFDKVNGINNTIRYNHFHSAQRAILMYGGGGSSTPILTGDKIYQNIFSNLKLVGIDMRYKVKDVQIYNNTFHQVNASSDYGTITFCTANNVSNIEIYNNVLSESVKPFHFWQSDLTPLSYLDYNTYYESAPFLVKWANIGNGGLSGWKSHSSKDTNSNEENPSFVNAGSESPEGFKLSSDSPLKNAGRNGVTIGAYITGTEAIGPSGSSNNNQSDEQSNVPASPTNLRIVEN